MQVNEHILLTVPQPVGHWRLADGYTHLTCYKRPSRWHQFWHRLLLGWRFIEVH